MDANTVTAICATVIAVASLTVSIQQTQAIRHHNRQSVRPLLEVWTRRTMGGFTGISLVNYGLGPAIITRTVLTLDGVILGSWDEPTVNALRETLESRPHALTFHRQQAIPAGFDAGLLYLNEYDQNEHAWFSELIRHRISLVIYYESLHGGEGFKVTLNSAARPPRPDQPDPAA
jgi:hypothetical protein